MRVLITGGTGMLGCDLTAALERRGLTPLPYSHQQLELTNQAAVEDALRSNSPDLVVNCAAYTAVDQAESEPEIAAAVNHLAAKQLGELTAKQSVPLVQISTDYVFNGEKRTPYLESDKTDPQNIYGKTKLAGELAVRSANPSHWIIRTAWLFGSEGSNFVKTVLKLTEKQRGLEIVDDQTGCPTWTAHLADALLTLVLDRKASYGTYHLASSGSCSWYQFAVEILKQCELKHQVQPVSSKRFPRPAQRPSYSVLASEHVETPTLPNWQDGLREFLATLPAKPS